MAWVTHRYFWVHPYPCPCLPILATHRSQVMGHGRYGFHQGLGEYSYLIIYIMTIIKPPYKQALVGMGVECGGEPEKRKEKNKNAQETLGLFPHCLSFPLLPVSFGVAGYAGGLDLGGVGAMSSHCSNTVHHLLVPSPFSFLSSPSLSSLLSLPLLLHIPTTGWFEVLWW